MRNLMKKPKRKSAFQMPPPSDAANARLRSLPWGRQVYIAEKYYGKQMPWREDSLV